jgi:hypothetical protein
VKLVQNFGDSFTWISMRRDWSTDTDIICARFHCLPRRHESFLIARLGPYRTNSLNDYFDFVAEFCP